MSSHHLASFFVACSMLGLAACGGEAGGDSTGTDASSDVALDTSGGDTSSDAPPGDADPGSCRGLAPDPTEPEVTFAEPVFTHPDPTGPYAVGTTLAWFTDPTREETNDDSGALREVPVQFWYPTDATDGPYGPLVQPGVEAWFEGIGFPEGANGAIETRSRFDVPIAENGAPLPVIIYSHGLTSVRTENTLLMEELASRGWFVVGVSHPYASGAAVMSDGSVAPLQGVPEFPVGAGPDEFRANLEQLRELLVRTWAADVVLVLDALEALDDAECTWIGGRLDLDRVGLMGFSFGGATAHHVCVLDERCDAAIDIDGTHFGDLGVGSGRPLMFIKSEDPLHEPGWDELLSHHSGDAYTVRVHDVVHANFSNFPAIAEAFQGRRARELGFGNAVASRVLDIVRDYTVAFLDQHVLGVHNALMDGPSEEYPDVFFEHLESGRATGTPAVFGRMWNGGERSVEAREAEVMVGDELVWTDAAGRFRFDVVPGEPIDIEFDHPDSVPAIWTVFPERKDTNLGIISVPTEDELTELLDGVGETPDPERGLILVSLIDIAFRAANIGGRRGATLTVDGYTTYYGGEDGLDPELDATLSPAWAIIPNVEPGSRTVALESGDGDCFVQAVGESEPNTADIQVRSGVLTYVRFICFAE